MTSSQISQLAAWRALSPDASMDIIGGHGVYNPHQVVIVAESVLNSKGSGISLGERLNILEQLMIAHLETDDISAAFDCYREIAAKFPAHKSVRTMVGTLLKLT